MLKQIVTRKKAVFAKQQVGYRVGFTLGQSMAAYSGCVELELTVEDSLERIVMIQRQGD